MPPVEDDYVHKSKSVVPAETLRVGAAILKIYAIAVPQDPVPSGLVEEARGFLAREIGCGSLDKNGDLGFALLHRCGSEFYFLLVSVWREANELWEAVYYRDAGMSGFAPFAPANPGPPNPLRPTFCIWELGVVRHEANCWVEFLRSARDADALRKWEESLLTGAV